MKLKCAVCVAFGMLVVSTGAFAENPPPAPKEPTYEEIKNQLAVTTEMLNSYRMRAIQAEDRLLSLAASQAVDKAKAKALEKK